MSTLLALPNPSALAGSASDDTAPARICGDNAGTDSCEFVEADAMRDGFQGGNVFVTISDLAPAAYRRDS